MDQITEENFQKIKQEIAVFFQKTGFGPEIEIRTENPRDLTVPVNLTMETPQMLIGERGQSLAEIQRLLKIVLTKKIGQLFYIDLDINDYKKNKLKYLKELAKTAADEVSLLKTEKRLEPMTAYERRIIHLELVSRKDVVSESFGQEPDRRIVISPRP